MNVHIHGSDFSAAGFLIRLFSFATLWPRLRTLIFNRIIPIEFDGFNEMLVGVPSFLIMQMIGEEDEKFVCSL